jgi:broad specificity phosphatase PhoE
MQIVLVRHGETEWSKSGQHTGRTDVPLTEEGRRRALALGETLRGHSFRVYTSPLRRARETCALAGFGDTAIVEPDLVEWDYGVYEGRRTLDIRAGQPDWSVWLSPITGGEQLEEVATRARRVIDRVVATGAPETALFAHGHILRVLAACWMGLPPLAGRYLSLDTASISVLGFERQTRVIRQWNVTPGGALAAGSHR